MHSLCNSGEFIIPDNIERLKSEYNELYYLGKFLNDNARYRKVTLDKYQFDIIMFGNSRVNQFRSEMFEPVSFYNFANQSTHPYNIIKYINSILEIQQPKYFLIQIDPQNFSLKSNVLKYNQLFLKDAFEPNLNINVLERFVLKGGKFNTENFKLNNYLGIAAKSTGKGIRSSDGSMNLPVVEYKRSIRQQKNNAKLIASQIPKIVNRKEVLQCFKAELDSVSIDIFFKIDSVCNAKGSKVIFFTPSYISSLQNYFNSNHEKYPLWSSLENDVELLFEEKGMTYLNLNTTDNIVDDGMMRDALHLSERGAALNLQVMKREIRALGELLKHNKSLDQKINDNQSFPLMNIFSN